MDNVFFVTSTGKKITLKHKLSWSIVNSSDPEAIEAVERFKLPKDKFNIRPPSVIEMEDAIVNQLPAILIENYPFHDWQIVSRTKSKDPTKWISECEFTSISIPNLCWNNLFETGNKEIRENYFSYFTDILNNSPYEEIIFMTSYEQWLVFFKFEYGKIKYTVLSNTLSHFDAETGKVSMHQQFKFHSLFGNISNSQMPARVVLNRKWNNSPNIEAV